MKKNDVKNVLLLLGLAVCMYGHAQDGANGEAIQLQIEISNAKGAELRPHSKALVELVATKRLAEAERTAASLRKEYEAIFDRRQKQYSFQTKTEFDEFRKTHSENFEWIDWGYQQCLQMQTFIAAERRDFVTALAFAKEMDALAPISAGTAVETGYILNQSGKPAEGLIAYTRANELARTYPSQRPYRAAALRGMGFALIDLKRLEDAEMRLLESLQVEPGNKVALNELAYIRDLRSGK
ncbi:hypothetical protein ACO0LF_15320 [Undibacterium sp. Di27W]|uniref:hypothetical protein n=1 Tax=Undibacterium sp. Di27W TaxID=3413036 RepID=UPI003BF04A4B